MCWQGSKACSRGLTRIYIGREEEAHAWPLGQFKVYLKSLQESKACTQSPKWPHAPPLFLLIKRVLSSHIAGPAAHLAGGAIIGGQTPEDGELNAHTTLPLTWLLVTPS